jgi:DNA repair protein RadC
VALWSSLYPDPPDREELWMICLDTGNHPINVSMVSRGTLDGTLACGREIFKAAILCNAAKIILLHNHPSGNPALSDDDFRMGNSVDTMGEMLGIKLLDFIAIGDGAWKSWNSK